MKCRKLEAFVFGLETSDPFVSERQEILTRQARTPTMKEHVSRLAHKQQVPRPSIVTFISNDCDFLISSHLGLSPGPVWGGLDGWASLEDLRSVPRMVWHPEQLPGWDRTREPIKVAW